MTWKVSRLGVACAAVLFVACGGGKSDPIPAPDGDILLPDGGFAPAEIRNPVLVQTTAPAEVRAGDIIAVSCVIIDDRGEEFSSRGRTPRIRVAPEASVVRDGTDIVAAIAGEVEISCAFPDLMLTDESPAIVRILPGAPASVTTTVDRAQIEAGESIAVTCDVVDAYGNAILDAAPSVAVSPTDPGNTLEGLTGTFTRSGIYDVACELAGATSTTERVEVLPSLPAALALSKVPDQPVYATGQVVEVAAIVTDRFDNVVPDAIVDMVSEPAADDTLGGNRFRYFEDGTYVVTATVAPPTQDDALLQAQVTIVVNGNGPQIQCTGPRDGDMIVAAPGSTITVTGAVDDASGVAEVRVNGNLATLDGPNFRADVTTQFGINFVDVVARDSFGAESTATCAFLASARYADPGTILDDVLSLKLRQEAIDDNNRGDALDSLNDLLHAVLNSAGLRNQLDTTLRGMNPLYNNCEVDSWFGCVVRVRLLYDNDIQFNGPRTSTLQLVDGGLRASVSINELRARVRLTDPVGTSGWAIFERINIGVTFDVALVSGRPRITVRPGTTSVSIGNVRTDLSGVAGWIIDNIVLPIFRGTVRSAIENTLRNYISTSFNDVLDGVVAGLDISSLGTSLDVPRLDGSGSIPLSFGVGFSAVSTNPERFLVGIGSRFTAPVQIARPTLGVAVPPGITEPLLDDPSLTQSTSVSVHSALFNQVTHALWRAGLLQARVTGSGLGGGLPAGLVADIDGGLPPVVILRGNDGRAEIGIGSLNLNLVYPGLFDEPITLSLGARASTTVRLVGNDLSFDAITIEELFFSTPDVSLDAATRDVLERFLTTLVQSIVDRVLNDALPALPIPSFELPSSLSTYGIPAGTSLGIRSPALAVEPQHFVLRGNFGTL